MTGQPGRRRGCLRRT